MKAPWRKTPAERIRAEMRRNRHPRHQRARDGGYFWLPCDLCGEYWGGHEWVGRIHLPAANGQETGICPACEVDLGSQAAPFCETNGHRQVSVHHGRVQSHSQEGPRHRMGFSFDMRQADETYCKTCGVDLPAATPEETE